MIGKIVVTGYEGKIDWRSDVHSLEGKPEAPPELPDMMAMSKEFSSKFTGTETDEEKTRLRAELEEMHKKGQEKSRDFYKTAAGEDYAAKQSRDALVFKQDGTFRVEDIRGGKYSLRLEIREPGDEMSRYQTLPIAQLQMDLEIPITEGQSDEPYEVGVIEIPAKVAMKAGKSAPAFETKTVDGNPLKLSEF